ncbi:hypothetical protein XELAEV_18002523mg [Xenopus laevis]|nr:hypothetical protein XELAEV_18002523mg [Xenopus laevis]
MSWKEYTLNIEPTNGQNQRTKPTVKSHGVKSSLFYETLLYVPPTHLLSPPYCPHGTCLCFPPLVPDLDKGNMYLATMLVHKSRAGGRYQGAEG